MQNRIPGLPLEDVLLDLKSALREWPEAVLQTPTGARKTTGAPWSCRTQIGSMPGTD